MTKSRAKPSTMPAFVAPRLNPAQIAALADRVQQGDAVKTASVEEFSALLAELNQRGYRLRRRSESEKERAPFSFEVVRLEKAGKI